jgi:hypothetical protein
LSRSHIRSVLVNVESLISLLHTQLSMQTSTVPKGLDTTYNQAPVILEDSLGNVIPVPLELILSWEVR